MKLAATFMLATATLFACGPKYFSSFTIVHAATLSGQLLDPQGAAVPNLELFVKCGSAMYERTTDMAGNYDFGVLPPGNCKIGTTSQVYLPPEVKCADQGCAIEKLRFVPMSIT